MCVISGTRYIDSLLSCAPNKSMFFASQPTVSEAIHLNCGRWIVWPGQTLKWTRTRVDTLPLILCVCVWAIHMHICWYTFIATMDMCFCICTKYIFWRCITSTANNKKSPPGNSTIKAADKGHTMGRWPFFGDNVANCSRIYGTQKTWRTDELCNVNTHTHTQTHKHVHSYTKGRYCTTVINEQRVCPNIESN